MNKNSVGQESYISISNRMYILFHFIIIDVLQRCLHYVVTVFNYLHYFEVGKAVYG